MKIPFNIKYRPQIESGEYKVVTRDGNSVRIICWDRLVTEHYDNYNIVALVTETEYESTHYYYQDGHLWNKAKGEGDSSLDLFIVIPKSELTDFEEKVKELIGSYPVATKENKGGLLYEVQKAAAELLELAKKEICKGCTVGLDQYWKGREDARKEAEKSYTFHYPTHEPPCHYGGICTNPFKDCINCPRTGGDIGISTTSGTCKKD